MYSFFCDEVPLTLDIAFSNGIFDAKDGLSSKILFGLNAQVVIIIITIVAFPKSFMALFP